MEDSKEEQKLRGLHSMTSRFRNNKLANYIKMKANSLSRKEARYCILWFSNIIWMWDIVIKGNLSNRNGSVDLAFGVWQIAERGAWFFKEVLIIGHRLVLGLADVRLSFFIFVGCVDGPKFTGVVMRSSVLAFPFLRADVLRQNL